MIQGAKSKQRREAFGLTQQELVDKKGVWPYVQPNRSTYALYRL